ncbi:MAG: preprotein translocase subunit SecE [Candidatus Peribacteraceae bacterium]|nr:preprotein translocase subunit SecE [Candidatus Peribacteraceae bacterium]
MSAITSYITGSLEELRHVQWPTQQQAVRLTLIVIVFIAVNSAIFGLIDFGISKFISVTL